MKKLGLKVVLIAMAMMMIFSVSAMAATNVINDAGDLNQAINQATADDTITIDGSFTMRSDIKTIAITKNITIDLNGFTITGLSNNDIFTVSNGATLTIINGTLDPVGTGEAVTVKANASLVLEDVTINGAIDVKSSNASINVGSNVTTEYKFDDSNAVAITVNEDAENVTITITTDKDSEKTAVNYGSTPYTAAQLNAQADADQDVFTIPTKSTTTYISPDAYKNVVVENEGGSLVLMPKYPTKGMIAHIQANPEDGYEVDTITLTYVDANDETQILEITDKGDGLCSFVQPGFIVTIDVTFKVIGSEGAAATTPATWFELALNTVYANDAATNDVYAGDVYVTRGEFVQVLFNLADTPMVEGESYEDAEGWYEEAIIWANAVGVTFGATAENFNPEAAITAQEALTMLYRYAEYTEMDVTTDTEVAETAGFAAYAIAAGDWAIANGLCDNVEIAANAEIPAGMLSIVFDAFLAL